jgi:hypothetical protein
MRAPTGEIIFVAKQCDSDFRGPWLAEPLRGSERFRLKQAENDIQPWQNVAAEYMTHVSLGSLKLSRWCTKKLTRLILLTTYMVSLFTFRVRFLLLVGHLWHAGRHVPQPQVSERDRP